VFEAVDIFGGGARIVELMLFGFWYDVCFAVYLMGVVLLFFWVFDLVKYGVEML